MIRFLIVLAVCLFHFPAHAQDQGKTAIRNIAAQILPAGPFQISLLRLPDLLEGQVALRVSKAVSLTGCFKAKPLEFNVKAYSNRIDIEVSDPHIELTSVKRGQSCQIYLKELSGDVLIDRTQLVEENIQTLSLKSQQGRDNFKVETSAEKITLIPETQEAFIAARTGNRIDPLSIWFYPENTLILSAPSADKDVSEQIQDFALRHGMNPISSALPGFTNPTHEKNIMYVVDITKRFKTRLSPGQNLNAGFVLGQISLIGPQGSYEQDVKSPIFVRLPSPAE